MISEAASGRVLCAVISELLLIGCGSDPKEPRHCPIGDLSSPAEIQIIHQDRNGEVIATESMAQIPLIAPPQGGWIVLLGVRAKNIDGCQATLTTALVDACDHQLMKIDQRTTQLDVGADGWGQSSLTSFGNLQVCPQITATRDLYGVPYIIQVTIQDTGGQKAAALLTVVPTCPTEASRCTCECDRDYVEGSVCPAVPVAHGTCRAVGD